MIFWFIAAAMVAIALAFLLLPLLRRPRAQGPARSTINVDIYRDRLTELEAEHKSGVIAEAEYSQARAELERDMLADVGSADEPSDIAPTTPRAAVIAIAILVPAIAAGLYWKLGASDRIMTPVAQTAQPDMHSIEAMVNKLATRLEADPNNAEGWTMLGRSYVVLGRYVEAVGAFAKARQVAGDSAELLADQAEAMALANNNNLAGQPESLVEQALKADPNNPKALWLAGHAAIQNGRHAEGVAYWTRLIARLPPGSAGRQKVEQLIAQAQGQPNAPVEVQRQSDASAAKASITVQVALAPEFKSKVSASDTVFIFARAAAGPKMPLAIVKKQVKDLPLTVTLDDSMAMMPQMRLSSFPKVIVGARVSKSGTAMPERGDIEGQSPVLSSSDQKSVKVTIERAVP